MVIFISIYGCSDKQSIPSKILPPGKMEKVLWDMIQAEKYASNYLKDSTKNNKLKTFTLYEDIFMIHKITRQQFIESYKFYLTRPDITKVMFDSLATMAGHKREDVYKMQKRPEIKFKGTAQ